MPLVPTSGPTTNLHGRSCVRRRPPETAVEQDDSTVRKGYAMKPSRCLDVGGGRRGREGVAATQHGERRAGAGAAEREERGDGDPRDLAVRESSAILLHPPPSLAGVSIGIKKGVSSK